MTQKFDQAIKEIIQMRGCPYLVGGAVRDKFLGIQSKDLDIEVFHLTANELIEALAKVGTPNIDDKKFGVIRLDCGLAEAVEFALPRKDNIGERGFGGVFPNLSYYEAAKRRNFTCNAISESLVNGDIIDPLSGQIDLANGVIRHCDDAFFGEDPLRAIIGFRLAGLLNARVAPRTADIIEALIPEVKELSPEAMWSEFEKWAKRSIKPSAGLKFMRDTGLIECFPEIEALIGCPQDPAWHPEGDVFSHTCYVVDAAAGQGVVVVLAALCHDFGKATTTFRDRNPFSNTAFRWVSPQHAAEGEVPTRSFLTRIGAPKKITEQVVRIVREHMVHNSEVTKKMARRLLVRLEPASIDDLFAVIEADHSGRPPLPQGLPQRAVELKARCDEVEGEVKPFVLGRHLIAEGLEPGPHFGPILKAAEEAQLDGLFDCAESGIEWLKGVGVI